MIAGSPKAAVRDDLRPLVRRRTVFTYRPARFAELNVWMCPEFVSVDQRRRALLTARHTNGIVTKALKEGTAHGTRMSMDQYLSHPVTDRASFAEMKQRYDPMLPLATPSGGTSGLACGGRAITPLPPHQWELRPLLAASFLGRHRGDSYLFYDDRHSSRR